MEHDWHKADFDGTVGWYRCSVCGSRVHVPQRGKPETEPQSLVPCEVAIEQRLASLEKVVRRALRKNLEWPGATELTEPMERAFLKRLLERMSGG